ncbi:MAG: hypothetical protein AAFY88_00155 [Acidobacteriota bacterium]
MTHHDQSLRQYLLSKLGDSESTVLEGDLLEDPELFERTDAIHGELMVDLAAGKLPEADSVPLEKRLEALPGGSQEKLFFQSLAGRLAARPPGRSGNARRRFWPRAPAASALLAAVLTFSASFAILGPSWNSGPAGPPAAAPSPQAGASAVASPVKAIFILEPLTRSVEATPTIAGDTELVGLWLSVPVAGDAFRVSVVSGGDTITRLEEPQLIERPWGTYVALELEAERLPESPLELLLDEKRGSDWVRVASYSVRLAKR